MTIENKEYHQYTVRFFDKAVTTIGGDRIWTSYNTSQAPLGLKESMEVAKALEDDGCIVEVTRLTS
jgi:hypothetical protein